MDELAEARDKKIKKDTADAIMTELGVNAEGLAAIAESAPDEIRKAILDGLERQNIYRAIGRRHAEADEAEGIPGDRCCNMVCEKFKQSERVTYKDDGVGRYQVQEGKRDYCLEGVDGAQGCVYRMSERPPSDPFSRIPSHAEAVRMLMRAGLMPGDEFGHFDGTDFAFHKHTRELWFSYLDALMELGKIPKTNYGDAADSVRKMQFRPK